LIDVDVGLFSQRQFSFHRSSSLLVHAGLFPQLHVSLLLSQLHISLWVPNFPKTPLFTRGQKKKADSYYEGASIRAVDYWNLKKVAREIRKGAREDSDVFCSSVSIFHSLSFFPGIFVRARSLGIS